MPLAANRNVTALLGSCDISAIRERLTEIGICLCIRLHRSFVCFISSVCVLLSIRLYIIGITVGRRGSTNENLACNPTGRTIHVLNLGQNLKGTLYSITFLPFPCF